jgi:glycosyltransferase involved in cell wall biosynthesis
MKTLVIFTSCYPFSVYETYLEIEILYLAKVFDEIYIISNERDTSRKRITPPNVKSYSVPYNLTLSDKFLSWFQAFRKDFWEEIKFMRSQYKQQVTFSVINTILQSLYKVNRVKNILLQIIPGILDREDITLYSYWANDNAVAIAHIKNRYPSVKAVTRAHRWDVYFYEKGSGYLPFRKFLAENLDRIYFISEHAKNYFVQKTGLRNDKFLVSRLGVYSFQSPVQKERPDENHLVSCSYIDARKRVSLIAKALECIDERYVINWTHIGDGELMPEVRNIITNVLKVKKNITVDLKGMMSRNEVKAFYEQNYVDVFINVSESEGVPVSIMESFSASIPAIATDADGTSEIVINDLSGWLLPSNVTPRELSEMIQKYIAQPEERKLHFRSNARTVYLEKYDESINYNDFAVSLSNL